MNSQVIAFLPFFLLALTIASTWVFDNVIYLTAAMLSSLALGLLCGQVEWLGALAFSGVAGSLLFAERAHTRFLRLLGHFFFVGLVTLYYLYRPLPFFHSFNIFNQVRFSPDSVPFNMALNFDGPFAAAMILIILNMGKRAPKPQNFFKITLLCSLLCAATLLLPATKINFLRFDPKIPANFLLWAFNNLIFVCVAEETIFRRYLLNKLTIVFSIFKIGKYFALFLSSLLFGIIHYRGGPAMILLSTIAGLFYGTAYLRTQRIEAAILTHFGLNLIHILFFSYPALQH